MKKSLFTAILLATAFVSCKKENANRKTIDTTPRLVQIIFTNHHISSKVYYTLNEHTNSVGGLNSSFDSLKDSYQVKVGDILTANMFTGDVVTSDYSIKFSYSEKELAYSNSMQTSNGVSTVTLKHTFTSDDFK